MKQSTPPCRTSIPAAAPLLAIRIIGIIAGTALVCALALIVAFGNGSVSYGYSVANQRVANNVALIVVIACAVLASIAFTRCRQGVRGAKAPEDRPRRMDDRAFRRWCLRACAGVFLVEEALTAFVGFVPGWDVMPMVHGAVYGIPLDEIRFSTISDYSDYNVPYLAMYPNNAFLAGFLSAICKVVPGSVFLKIVPCLCVSVSIFLISRIVLSLTGSRRWTVASLALSVLLIGLLPWFFVPYSDVFGFTCVTSALWALTCLSRPFLRWSAFFAFSAVGFLLKPTAVFLPIAVVLVYALAASGRRFPLRPALRAGAGALAGCGVAALVYAALILPTGFAPDRDKAFGPAHYLMMGLNEESGGGYSQSDVLFSLDQPSKEARDEANWEVARQRVSDMGFVGTVELFAKKTLSNYNDGTFAWGQDQPFFPPEFEGYMSYESYVKFLSVYEAQMGNPVARALASYYWGEGRNYPVFQTVQQAVWLTTLLGSALCLLGMATRMWRRLDPWSTTVVVAVLASLVMVTVFLMVFECRARYLYLYSGLYIVASIWGYRCLFQRAAAPRGETPPPPRTIDDGSREPPLRNSLP